MMVVVVNLYGEQMVVPRQLEENVGRELLAAGWAIKALLA